MTTLTTVTFSKPFTVEPCDNMEFPYYILDGDGEPLAYAPDLATAELIIQALNDQGTGEFVSHTVEG